MAIKLSEYYPLNAGHDPVSLVTRVSFKADGADNYDIIEDRGDVFIFRRDPKTKELFCMKHAPHGAGRMAGKHVEKLYSDLSEKCK